MKFLSLLLLAIAAFAQDVTTDIYWLSKPPQVSALKPLPDNSPERISLAEDLARSGFKVDVPIMVWGWDAYKVMKLRGDLGYTWVPSALMPNITIAPGLMMAGTTPYDPNSPPSGSIKVSVDAKDYPAFERPVEVKTPESQVGPQSIGNLYLTVAGDTSPADSVVVEARGKFVKRVKASPFGSWAYWEKIQ